MTDKRKEIWETLDAGLTKWMSKAYQTGKQDERQRIIGLLEALSECKAEPNHDDFGDCYCATVALLKGESNE
jgi:hypothetical protein